MRLDPESSIWRQFLPDNQPETNTLQSCNYLSNDPRPKSGIETLIKGTAGAAYPLPSKVLNKTGSGGHSALLWRQARWPSSGQHERESPIEQILHPVETQRVSPWRAAAADCFAKCPHQAGKESLRGVPSELPNLLMSSKGAGQLGCSIQERERSGCYKVVLCTCSK